MLDNHKFLNMLTVVKGLETYFKDYCDIAEEFGCFSHGVLNLPDDSEFDVYVIVFHDTSSLMLIDEYDCDVRQTLLFEDDQIGDLASIIESAIKEPNITLHKLVETLNKEWLIA